ncbi:MAG: dicarboxylate/amino acid:cation symporter, partial [Massilibacteroides sp.]|nr:dicarboxylate/amino acid:cation symporter [Massilibacteroides sp.]
MKKYKKKAFPLYLQIMLGMLIGIGIGFVALQFNQGTFIKDWIYPWGALFIRLLQLVAVPLVFISLVKGVTGLGNISRISQLGTKTISIYILTTIVAVLLGMALGGIIQPGKLVNKDSIPQIENNDISRKQIEK